MSNDTPAISVQGVGKAYRIWGSPAARLTTPLLEAGAGLLPTGLPLREGLMKRASSNYRDFWALRDISFEVRRGEAVGIIGRNGSGKSTLLQIIAGTLQPTTGSVQVNGRVAALLELGSGFNPYFTGRENVYLAGAVLGLSKGEIDQRFEAIAAFADIGDFLEEPVHTYSSGMSVRLAFAVCAHVDAEIMIIDEALAVGDARFQLKCARTIDRFLENGRTLLFVSHDANSINRLCSAALLLEQGRQQLLHAPRTVTNLYAKMMADDRGLTAILTDLDKARATPFDRNRDISGSEHTAQSAIQSDIHKIDASISHELQGAAADQKKLAELEQELLSKRQELELLERALLLRDSEVTLPPESASGREFSMGDGGVVIEKIEMLDCLRNIQKACQSGTPFIVQVGIRAVVDVPQPVFAVRIRNAKGMDIYGTNTLYRKTSTTDLRAGDRIEVCFTLTASMLAGHYFISAGCSHFEGNNLIVHHRRYDALEIVIHQNDQSFGIVQCAAQISTRLVSPASSA